MPAKPAVVVCPASPVWVGYAWQKLGTIFVGATATEAISFKGVQQSGVFLFNRENMCTLCAGRELMDNHQDDIWRLAISESLISDLTPAMRNEIIEGQACEFVDWVLEGYKREIMHRFDPP